MARIPKSGRKLVIDNKRNPSKNVFLNKVPEDPVDHFVFPKNVILNKDQVHMILRAMETFKTHFKREEFPDFDLPEFNALMKRLSNLG